MTVNTTIDSATTRAFKPLRITSLPVDVLCVLCELVCEAPSTAGYFIIDIERFQLVCRLFREVVLSLPHLWSFVDDSMSVERMETQITRCGGASIDMGFRMRYDRNPDNCKCARWEFIKSHSNCWTYAIMQIDYPFGKRTKHSCLATLHAVCFPSMITLVTDFSRSHYYNKKTLRFQWSLPRLENLSVKNNRTEELGLPVDAPLKCVTIAPDRESLIPRLVTSLFRSPVGANITELVIDFIVAHGILYDPHMQRTSFLLRKLRRLTAYNGLLSSELAGGTFYEFLYFFDCPGLVIVTIELQPHLANEYTYMVDFCNWLKRVASESSLKRVNLLVPYGRWNEEIAKLVQKVWSARGAEVFFQFVVDTSVVPLRER
jgi:hypothetical protein